MKKIIFVEFVLGLVIFITSMFLALEKIALFYILMVTAWLLLADGFNQLNRGKSFFQYPPKTIIIMLAVGGFIGGIIELANLLLGNALWSYSHSLWIPILGWIITFPTAIKTNELLNRLIGLNELNNRFRPLQMQKYVILIIGIMTLFLGYFSKTIPLLAFAFWMTAIILITESVAMIRRQSSLTEEIILNPKFTISIILQAFGSAILVEKINTFSLAWEYHSLNFQILGLYPFITLGWIPLIYLLLSAYRSAK